MKEENFQPYVFCLQKPSVSGSAKQINEYINKWDLAVLKEKSETIENDYIMKALQLSDYKCPASQLLLEHHLGSAVDKQTYANNCKKLMSRLLSAKKCTQSEKVWAAFLYEVARHPMDSPCSMSLGA